MILLVNPLGVKGLKKTISLNPFTPKSDFIDFALSNIRQFYSSTGGLTNQIPIYTKITFCGRHHELNKPNGHHFGHHVAEVVCV